MVLGTGEEADWSQSLERVTLVQLSRTLLTLRHQFREDLRRELRDFFCGEAADLPIAHGHRSRELEGKPGLRARFDTSMVGARSTSSLCCSPSPSPRTSQTRAPRQTFLVKEAPTIRQVIVRKGTGTSASSSSRLFSKEVPRKSARSHGLESFPLPESPPATPRQGSESSKHGRQHTPEIDITQVASYEPMAEEWIPPLPHKVMRPGAKPATSSCFAATTPKDAFSKWNSDDELEKQTLLESTMPRDAALHDLREEKFAANVSGERHQGALVLSQPAQLLAGFLAVLNAILIGVETDYQLQHLRAPQMFTVLSKVFCVVFTLEAILKVYALRTEYFCGKDSAWYFFEFGLVCQQILDELSKFAVALPVGFARPLGYLRILRAVRIVRLFRSVHNFGDLPALMASFQSSVKPFFMSMLTLAVLLYIAAVWFADLITVSPELQPWFGSLLRTMLTLYECMLSGVSWDEVARPLISQVSPLAGFALCLFVGAAMIAVLNIVTGLFVDKAIRTADQAQARHLIETITDAFLAHDTDLSQGITADEFRVVLSNGWMQEYFDVIGIDASEGMGLFDLMDSDGSGSIDALEFVSGCLRLRGPAKAMELALLHRVCKDISESCKYIRMLMEGVDHRVTDLGEKVSTVNTTTRRLQTRLDTPKLQYAREQYGEV